MPNYYPRSKALPLTPPELTMYNYRGINQGAFAGQSSRKNAYEPAENYGPYVAPPAPLMGYQPAPMHYNNMPPAPPPGLPHPGQSFGPIAAPILPPITDRNVDSSSQSQSIHQQQQQQQQQQQHEQQRRNKQSSKDEKSVGGVSAVLDYEMDQMTEYVSEMAQTIVMPGTAVSPAFRKFVSGLLSSTRLPSSTILLGLTYLARRMSMLNSPAPYKANEGQVWRMLTVALLLGSKFLDDNTFQNRSWSEVSGISVAELNTLEQQWLEAIQWNLHINLDTSEDFQAWLVSWPSWCDSKDKQRSAAAAAAAAAVDRLAAPLAPINTNIQRQKSQRKAYSPQSAYPAYGPSMAQEQQQQQQQQKQRSMYHSGSRYDQSSWMHPSSASELSPPSAPESGPTTPEYMNLPGAGLPPSDWYSYNSYNSRRLRPAANQPPYGNNQMTPYQTPFNGFYAQAAWNGHGAGCGCGYCSRTNDSYGMASSYGQQTVAG